MPRDLDGGFGVMGQTPLVGLVPCKKRKCTLSHPRRGARKQPSPEPATPAPGAQSPASWTEQTPACCLGIPHPAELRPWYLHSPDPTGQGGRVWARSYEVVGGHELVEGE